VAERRAIDATRILTANRGDAAVRLDLVVRRHLADLRPATRARVQAWISDGQVSVNGRLVRRVATRVALGDVIAVSLPSTVEHRANHATAAVHHMAREDAADLEILYEDAHLLAVNKRAGVVVHQTYKHATGTLMNALLWRARTWSSAERPSIVGRLDKLTSGIVLVAKTSAVHAMLQRAMSAPDADKKYLAVVYGRVKKATSEIRLRLRRDTRDRRRVVASPNLGSESVTRIERLARGVAPDAGLTLLQCTLVTGRMHQIRVHLAASGWPLVGDPVYGEPRWRGVCDPELAAVLKAFPRQALHAWRLALTHPVSGVRLQFEAPLPSDLEHLMTAGGLCITRSAT
jgi:23S rRNA pseudouridine1911/1915/1917 synthase